MLETTMTEKNKIEFEALLQEHKKWQGRSEVAAQKEKEIKQQIIDFISKVNKAPSNESSSLMFDGHIYTRVARDGSYLKEEPLMEFLKKKKLLKHCLDNDIAISDKDGLLQLLKDKQLYEESIDNKYVVINQSLSQQKLENLIKEGKITVQEIKDYTEEKFTYYLKTTKQK